MENSKLQELYEVFRVESGIALFIEDHLARLFSGAKKAKIELKPDFKEIMCYLNNFLSSSELQNGNVRFSVIFNVDSLTSVNYNAQIVPYIYPSKKLYKKGVYCLLMNSERDNPQTKIANNGLRQTAKILMENEKAFEVLLFDKYHRITEGSRSNVFFIKNDLIITAPDDKVLPGVIRKKTIEIAESLKITVKYQCIRADRDLEFIDAAFITGTSPRILPIHSIKNIKFKPNHPIIIDLIHQLNDVIAQYISIKS
jgi:branched-chain amino acid aminotransferase